MAATSGGSVSTCATRDVGDAQPASRIATGALAIVAVASAVGVLVATARYGTGLTPDSVTYLVGAQSVAGVVFVAVNVVWFAGRAVNSAQKGAGGYATERWQESDLMDDVAPLDLTRPTYSNVPRAVAAFLDEPVR